MRNNIVQLGVGIIIVLIPLALSLIVKDKKPNSKVGYYEKQNEKNMLSNRISLIDSKVIMEKITKIELEILELRKENSRIVEQYKKADLLTGENSVKGNNFKQTLSCSLFKEKNKIIIDLYNKGKSKEEIAKTLNKSIGEIEMLINLVK